MAWLAARTVSVNTSAPWASRMAFARLPSSSYFPLDWATISRRLENASRYWRAARPFGAGVALREVGDRGEEVAERLHRHAGQGTEQVAGVDELVLGGDVLGPLVDREVDADERHARRRAHAVGDGLVEAVAVADAAEVRDQELGDGVVGALQRGGETEPLLVLREHGPPQGRTAEPVALVGHEQATDACRGHGLVRRRRVTGGHEHVAVGRSVGAAVAQTPDARAGQGVGEAAAPLLHEDA